ncbi:ribonuclease H2 subunit C, putative [Plasmodium malariae]|uniref:Ribonuclease H2 subunit C, putative n=1 Tax=Plasmodium malariae TaxID=5858 RepID=A0A1C3KBQ0_PLAMA|nr:ribonuclease H2 subunit C, putative [Plasmodium malariae]
MYSFFGEDTKEEEKLLQTILKSKDDELPDIVKEIATSHLVQRLKKKEEGSVKSESTDIFPIKNENSSVTNSELEVTTNKNKIKKKDYGMGQDHRKDDPHTSDELLNVHLNTNIFSFHIKRNGKINADVFFLPYKSKDNKDMITEYTYNYDYYDIYPKNIEMTNKCFHANKRKLEQSDELLPANKKVRVKQEVVEGEEGKEECHETDDMLNSSKKNYEHENTNFQKFLVHFRGRLFIGNNVKYAFFKTKTYLATIQNWESAKREGEAVEREDEEGELLYANKKIQTYNLINDATYWKQDEYPDISDQNIQKLLFFLIVPPLKSYSEGEQTDHDVVF